MIGLCCDVFGEWFLVVVEDVIFDGEVMSFCVKFLDDIGDVEIECWWFWVEEFCVKVKYVGFVMYEFLFEWVYVGCFDVYECLMWCWCWLLLFGDVEFIWGVEMVEGGGLYVVDIIYV